MYVLLGCTCMSYWDVHVFLPSVHVCPSGVYMYVLVGCTCMSY